MPKMARCRCKFQYFHTMNFKSYSYTLILLILFSTSCKQKREQSAIEIKLRDSAMISLIKKNYDSIKVEELDREDFSEIEYYFSNDTISKIVYDNNSNIVAIHISDSLKNIYTVEFYSNGQQRGPLFKNGLTVKDSIKTTYYYEDGRVRSIGYWHNYKQIGLWKNYDEQGYLKTIETFSNNGDLIEKEIIE